jgi:hypothetical protein
VEKGKSDWLCQDGALFERPGLPDAIQTSNHRVFWSLFDLPAAECPPLRPICADGAPTEPKKDSNEEERFPDQRFSSRRNLSSIKFRSKESVSSGRSEDSESGGLKYCGDLKTWHTF